MGSQVVEGRECVVDRHRHGRGERALWQCCDERCDTLRRHGLLARHPVVDAGDDHAQRRERTGNPDAPPGRYETGE